MNNKNRRYLFQAGGLYHVFLDRGFSGYVKPHSHTFYQCVIVKNGRITQMHDSKTHSQLCGDVLFTPPNCEHSLFVFDNDTNYYSLSFSEKIMEAAAATLPDFSPTIAGESMFFTFKHNEFNLLIQNLDLLLNEPEHTQPGVYNWGCCVCTAAVVLLLNAMKAACAGRCEAARPYDPARSIADALRYIDQHYYEEMKIDKLVEMSSLSKSSFCTYFYKIVGITPKQYITEKRMHEALRLIRDTDMPFVKIADEVGYSDFSTFFRNFCKMTNASPSDYRRKILADKKE